MTDDVLNACAECGSANDARALFCGTCGVSLRERCPHCQAAIRAQQKFCSACGAPLAGAGTRIQTPKHLEERIRRTRPSGEAERKIATVLFADIVNSTPLIEGRDPEEAKQILESAVQIMNDAIHRYLGTVTRRTGDGIMSSFGAPIALEDHAVMACYSALDLQEAIRAHARRVEPVLGQRLQARVGINSGLVVVTVHYEEGDFREIRVDGVPTHIAARLETNAPAGTILLSRETLALAEGFIRVGSLAPLTVKGVEKPVEVCQLLGVGTRKRIHAHAVRGLSKFVGREVEVEALRRGAAQALSGQGQVVALVGEAGVGKSRVILEFLRSSSVDGWLVMEAGSLSYGKATSYLPLIELLTRYFEIHARDDEATVRDKIVRKLSAFGEAQLIAQTPFFLGVLGMGTGSDAWANLTPAERQSSMFMALKQLLIRESQKQPLCLVFEDLHWVDAETHAFLEMLLGSVPAARVLLLVNYRPEFESGWAGRSYFSQVRIDPLPASSSDEMLDGLLGRHAELAPVKQTLVDITEGNPLFLEESVRSLIEGGVLAGTPGEWRPLGSIPAGFVPRTIEALLAARIDRLSPELKELLQCAAVIGADIPRDLLAAVAGVSQAEADRGLRALQTGEFLFEKAVFPEVEYTFKHSMTRQVAYQSLVRARRTQLHARALRALEALSAGRIEEPVERLADHAESGEVWDKALDYLERSGRKAYSLFANVEAAGFFQRALDVLRRLPESRTTLEQAIDLRFELRNALLGLGATDRILQCLEELEPLLDAIGDKLRRARYAAFRCNYHFLAAENRRAMAYGNAGVVLADECGESALKGELLYRVGQSYHNLGQNREGVARLKQSLEYTPTGRERGRFGLVVIPAVVNRTWLVYALVELGEFNDAMVQGKQALEIARSADHQPSEALAWLAMGHLLLRKGELGGAVGSLEFGLQLCDKWAGSLHIWRPRIASTLGLAYARSGDSVKGLELAAQALVDVERMRLKVDRPPMLERLSEVSLIAGRVADALAYATQAIEAAQAHEARVDEAWARLLHARACCVEDPRDANDTATKQLDTALRIAEECEALPLIASCNTALAAIHSRRDDHAAAQEFNARANAIYEKVGMRPRAIERLGTRTN
jgi:class 3 adenylate cyclase/tetratricopeptide (TPR) repeat protein